MQEAKARALYLKLSALSHEVPASRPPIRRINPIELGVENYQGIEEFEVGDIPAVSVLFRHFFRSLSFFIGSKGSHRC